MQTYTLVQSITMPVSQWAGGATRQLAIFPATATVAAQDFQWRFSSATVLQDGPFTRYPKHQRLLALRQGAGFVVEVDAQQQRVSSTQQVLRFAGNANSQARLLDAAVVDINLMFDDSLQAQLWSQPCFTHFIPLEQPIPAAATLLIYADHVPLQIRLSLQHPPILLAQGDLLQLHPPIQTCWCRLAPEYADSSHEPLATTAIEPTTGSAVVAWLAAAGPNTGR